MRLKGGETISSRILLIIILLIMLIVILALYYFTGYTFVRNLLTGGG